ncbi:MAG: YihY/virulence factor BrkB family protein [Gammaproteobacteria bacterium]
MPSAPPHLRFIVQHPLQFLLRVVRGFGANQGVLLGGAVAFYTLLSIVPMIALALVVLSKVMDQALLLQTVRTYLELVAPGKADAVVSQAEVFLREWKLIGAVGLVVLLFFSSMAFSVLERAMSVIFHHRVQIRRRHFLVSAVIPYAYIMVLTAGLLLLSAVVGALHALDGRTLQIMGHVFSLQGATPAILRTLGIIGEILLLASLYLVMPVGRLNAWHALLGGACATLLWEIVRRVLFWYFTTLSFVNVIYGSFATVIVILLSLEAAAVIVLLGAQVIAEYERIGDTTSADDGFRTGE